MLTTTLLNRLRARLARRPSPPIGRVRLGDLRRQAPIDRAWGYRRGTPVDRYYIEKYLARHSAAVRGRVLEVGDATYTRRFGGSTVTHADVLFPEPGHAPATIVGDLASGRGIPAGVFDCALITQTLLLIYDVHGAMRTLHRALRPGGVLLATVPGISQRARLEDQRWGDYWRFTPRGVERLASEVFGAQQTSVEVFGNVLAATAFLYGIAAEELRRDELDHLDPDYPVTIAVRAEKA